MILTCHDYLFFASRDYGSSATTADIINNYALMYALNRDVSKVRRLTSKSKPHYREDLPFMQIYATAAYSFPPRDIGSLKKKRDEKTISFTKPLIGNEEFTEHYEEGLTGFTWNSLGETLLDSMKQDRLNIPKKGIYFKHNPLSTFHFFAIGDSIPALIRVGKKHSPTRLMSMELEVSIKEGTFDAVCPVTIADLPEETEILEGSFIAVPPTPLLLSARLRGRYFSAKDSFGGTYKIPIPQIDRYTCSIGRMEGII